MKIKILKVSQIRRPLKRCEDFAKLRWPEGATDYVARRNKGLAESLLLIIAGHHVDGWTIGVKRERVQGWGVNVSLPIPLKPGQIIWAKINGQDRRDPDSLAADIIEAAKVGGFL